MGRKKLVWAKLGKGIYCLMLSLLIAINLPLSIAIAATDVTPPELKSITIDKKSVIAGDSIKVTISATDNGGSGIASLRMTYESPITKKWISIRLNNVSGDKYEGTFNLSDTDESGIWKVKFVYLEDNLDNSIYIYNSATSAYADNKMDFSNCDFELSGTTTDISVPQLKSISIDKKSVVAGEGVKIAVNATDNGGSGIASLRMTYESPITKKWISITLNNVSGDRYEGTFNLSDTDESGIWKVKFVYLEDNLDNSIYIYNSTTSAYADNKMDFSNCDFELSGTTTDISVPQLKSISIDKKSVVAGEGVKIVVNATDNGGSGIASLRMTYESPITKKWISITLNNVSGDKYEGTFNLSDTDESGIWKVKFVYLEDNLDNSIYIYNSVTSAYADNKMDFSNCDFELKDLNSSIQPLPQKCVTKNELWTSDVVNGDLYIGPEAVLTISGSITVNGNIYVLGAMKNYGNLTVNGGIYARQFSWGSSTLYNGTVLMLGGTNSISSMIASNSPIDIPINLYGLSTKNEFVAYDGKLKIEGATLPIADLYVNGTKVNYNYNGTFSLDLNLSDKTTIVFEVVDVFGNRKTLSYNINHKKYDANGDGVINVLDLAILGKQYGLSSNKQGWKSQFDLNNDDIIDIYDIVRLSQKIS